jgi:hypothetical protein
MAYCPNVACRGVFKWICAALASNSGSPADKVLTDATGVHKVIAPEPFKMAVTITPTWSGGIPITPR